MNVVSWPGLPVTQAFHSLRNLRLGLAAFAVSWLAWGARLPAAQNEGSQLYVLDMTNSTSRPITTEPLWNHGSPAWSNDGLWLACDRWQLHTDARQARIHVMRVDGSERREFAPGGMPDWSPDDRQLVFQSVGEAATAVEVMNRDGSGREVVRRKAGSPRWSPNGRFLAFVDVVEANLSTLDLITMQSRTVQPDGWRPDPGLDWSPDGLQICYRLPGYRDEPSALVIVRLRDGQPRVRMKGDFGTRLAWSPDGTQILASRRAHRNERYQLVTLSAHDRTGPVLVPGQPADRHNADMDWSPDGQRIVFASFVASPP